MSAVDIFLLVFLAVVVIVGVGGFVIANKEKKK